MYHRIANRNSDPWQIVVSPENFEQHLQILKKYNVISIPELVQQLKNKKIEANSVCITFDDAYGDNYIYAKPLLEKYNLPATFFIASNYIGKNQQFWWDELENIILHSTYLPEKLSINIGGDCLEFTLEKNPLSPEDEAKHQSWVWEDTPPTLRCELYLSIWTKLKPLSESAIEQILVNLREWAVYQPKFNMEDSAMSHSQLKEIITNPLFTIGIHTLSHPALAEHNTDIQTKEIAVCKKVLEDICGFDIDTIAYPYGSYNNMTLSIAANQKLLAGFTTRGQVVDLSSNIFELGRMQVMNRGANYFDDWLQKCLWK
jgi:peptidoglycan/xylan/chitin deacetylase (PgdA/CDA1 family)